MYNEPLTTEDSMSMLFLSILLWLGAINTEQVYTTTQMGLHLQQNTTQIQSVASNSALASEIYDEYGERAAEVVIVDVLEQ